MKDKSVLTSRRRGVGVSFIYSNNDLLLCTVNNGILKYYRIKMFHDNYSMLIDYLFVNKPK